MQGQRRAGILPRSLRETIKMTTTRSRRKTLATVRSVLLRMTASLRAMQMILMSEVLSSGGGGGGEEEEVRGGGGGSSESGLRGGC